jgi:hypothetical protein
MKAVLAKPFNYKAPELIRGICPYLAALFAFAQRFFCASAIRFRASGLSALLPLLTELPLCTFRAPPARRLRAWVRRDISSSIAASNCVVSIDLLLAPNSGYQMVYRRPGAIAQAGRVVETRRSSRSRACIADGTARFQDERRREGS